MNPVKFLGILCMCLGVATMFLGTAMVPVAAPVWADVGGGQECKASCWTCGFLTSGVCLSGIIQGYCLDEGEDCGRCDGGCGKPSAEAAKCWCKVKNPGID
jgi:hypothetical protein